jgi:hypothetical protein
MSGSLREVKAEQTAQLRKTISTIAQWEGQVDPLAFGSAKTKGALSPFHFSQITLITYLLSFLSFACLACVNNPIVLLTIA